MQHCSLDALGISECHLDSATIEADDYWTSYRENVPRVVKVRRKIAAGQKPIELSRLSPYSGAVCETLAAFCFLAPSTLPVAGSTKCTSPQRMHATTS
jgi:hypothetical protein